MSKRKSCDLSESDSMEVVETNNNSKRAKNLMVSFSKRRQGLFGKASELCTKFNSQIAILVLSPSGNPFSFAHSSVDDVLRRYDNLRPRTAAEIGGGDERTPVMGERQRWQEREIEVLKARVKEKERIGSRESLSLTSLINDDNVQSSSESVEELECFKVNCLTLLNMVREKLRNDLSFVASCSGSGSGSGSCSFNVAENNNNNGVCNNNVYDQENDRSFCVASSVVGGSLEKNDMSPTDGSGGGSNNTVVESDDFFNFANQICDDGIGIGDQNNDFDRRFVENFEQFQDICSIGNDFDLESILSTGQQNDVPFWLAKSYDNSDCGFGSAVTTTVDSSSHSSFYLTCDTTWC